MKLLVAMRRPKDNDGEKLLVRRFLFETDEERDELIERQEAQVLAEFELDDELEDDYSVIWRYYESVNRRDVDKALTELTVKLVKKEIDPMRIESEWKSILQRPQQKLEKKWMLDVDTNDLDDINELVEYLGTIDTNIETITPTPNGRHIVVSNGFDLRELLERFGKFVDVKKDDLLFVSLFQFIA